MNLLTILTFDRSWWQLNGCVGVPLYKIYRRSTEWRSEMPPLPVEEPQEAEDADPEMALLTKRYASRLSKADSVEELMKSYYSDCGTAKSRGAAATTKSSSNGEATATGDSEEADSGRSTPGETNLSLVRPVEGCEISLAANMVLCRFLNICLFTLN